MNRVCRSSNDNRKESLPMLKFEQKIHKNQNYWRKELTLDEDFSNRFLLHLSSWSLKCYRVMSYWPRFERVFEVERTFWNHQVLLLKFVWFEDSTMDRQIPCWNVSKSTLLLRDFLAKQKLDRYNHVDHCQTVSKHSVVNFRIHCWAFVREEILLIDPNLLDHRSNPNIITLILSFQLILYPPGKIIDSSFVRNVKPGAVGCQRHVSF